MCNEVLFINLHSYCTMFPITSKPKKCAMRPLKKAPWMLLNVSHRFRNLRKSIRFLHPLRFITPDYPKTQGVCKRVVEKDPWQLKDVPDHFKTQEMCNKAVRRRPGGLKFV